MERNQLMALAYLQTSIDGNGGFLVTLNQLVTNTNTFKTLAIPYFQGARLDEFNRKMNDFIKSFNSLNSSNLAYLTSACPFEQNFNNVIALVNAS
jgi:hypothetical protein